MKEFFVVHADLSNSTMSPHGKALQKELNDSVEVVPVTDGAYRPLKATLSTIIAHEVLSDCVYYVTSRYIITIYIDFLL